MYTTSVAIWYIYITNKWDVINPILKQTADINKKIFSKQNIYISLAYFCKWSQARLSPSCFKHDSGMASSNLHIKVIILINSTPLNIGWPTSMQHRFASLHTWRQREAYIVWTRVINKLLYSIFFCPVKNKKILQVHHRALNEVNDKGRGGWWEEKLQWDNHKQSMRKVVQSL